MAISISLPCPRPSHKRALIYFIPGNPGLIDFYQVFLHSLRALLDEERPPPPTTAYDIYGRSLFGFDDADHAPFDDLHAPWDLQGQIDAVFSDVSARRTPQGQPYDSVILLGHSLGAYITVELFHRHARDPHVNLRHGLLLFPTLVHLALSPSGRKGSLLRRVPTLEEYGHVYAALALRVLPRCVLRWLLVRGMGFTAQTAEVAARWLKSRDGVRQALHLAVAELDGICEDTWGPEVWGDGDGNGGNGAAPRFFMFFGREDRWVAGDVREALVNGGSGGSKVEVDKGGVPHAFCVGEHTSWLVARKVCGWIGQIGEAEAELEDDARGSEERSISQLGRGASGAR